MDQLLKVSEVARMLRVDNTTIRRWVEQGILEAVTLPHAKRKGAHKAYRFKSEVIDAILNTTSASAGGKEL